MQWRSYLDEDRSRESFGSVGSKATERNAEVTTFFSCWYKYGRIQTSYLRNVFMFRACSKISSISNNIYFYN